MRLSFEVSVPCRQSCGLVNEQSNDSEIKKRVIWYLKPQITRSWHHHNRHAGWKWLCLRGRGVSPAAHGVATSAGMAGVITEPERLRAQALKSLILFNLGSGVASGLKWRPRITMPTVESLGTLRVMSDRAGQSAECIERVFHFDARLLALEECRRAWQPVVDELARDVSRG